MDGITLSVIRCELGGYLPLRVQKVQQPGKKELVFSVWSPSVRERLILSLDGPEPFFGFSDEKKENPQSPPGFCLGLRRRLEGGSLVSIRQEGLDRVLYLDFMGRDDFGGDKRYVLVFDMAGREQNIGLYDEGLLVASMVPADEGRFERRSKYTPPAGKRLDVREFARRGGPVELAAALSTRGGAAGPALSAMVEGAGKELVRGVLAAAGQGEASLLSPEGALAVASLLAGMGRTLTELCEGKQPAVGSHDPSGACPRVPLLPAIHIRPKGLVLHVFPLPHLTADTEFDTALGAARTFRERAIRSHEFEVALAQAEALHKRVMRKVQSRHEAQIDDLSRSRDYESYRVWAELIDRSGKRNPPGAAEMTVVDYRIDPPSETVVPLDPKKSSRDNARAYYQAYGKMVRAEKVLKASIARLEADLEVLAGARTGLDRSLNVADVSSAMAGVEGLARREGIAMRVRRVGARSGGSVEAAASPVKVRTAEGPDGSTFLTGGSARQNDELVTGLRMPGDVWFHAKGVKGAHVLARPAPGRELSEAAILAAARLSAEKSGAKRSSKVEVDYVDAMRVRKPRGSAPGFVTYTGQKTVMVSLE